MGVPHPHRGSCAVVIVLDIAGQAILVLGQTRPFGLSAEERSRLNIAVIVFNFAGGALGSFLAGPLWAASGWTAIIIGALTLIGGALVVWLLARDRLANNGPE